MTWIYAAAFGVPAIPVGIYLSERGRLPTFLDLFEMYGGPWSGGFDRDTLLWLLTAFLLLTVLAAWSAWLLWKGSKRGAVLNMLLLPVEAVFWFGFALPVPWLLGIARAVLIPAAWRSLR